MPAMKGWIQTVAIGVFSSVWDALPQFRDLLRYEIGGDGVVCIYFRSVSPSAVLRFADDDFFNRYNILIEAWEPVFRTPGGYWERFEGNGRLSEVDFGWRHRESIL